MGRMGRMGSDELYVDMIWSSRSVLVALCLFPSGESKSKSALTTVIIFSRITTLGRLPQGLCFPSAVLGKLSLTLRTTFQSSQR